MAADLDGDTADGHRVGVGLQPALGTGPIHQLIARQAERRRVVRQRQAPQRTRVGEEGQALLAQVVPVSGVKIVATDTLAGSTHRAFAAFQTQVQRLAVMAGGADRDRLLAPLGELEQRALEIDFQTQAGAQARLGQHLERDFGEYAEATEAAGHQARQVVAGDVLHHLATETQVLALAGDDPRAEHEIAHRTAPRATRAGQPGGDHAADGGALGEVRRLARQHLPGSIERGFQLRQRRTGANGDHQLGGVIGDEAAMLASIEQHTVGLPPEKALAAAALDAQRRVGGERLVDLVQQLRAGVVGDYGHQKRSSSGKGSWPLWMCMRPNSAQRCRVGMFLPGLSRPLGSKAAFTAWNSVSSSALNCEHI